MPEIQTVPYKVFFESHGKAEYFPGDDSLHLKLWMPYPAVCNGKKASLDGFEGEIEKGAVYVIVPKAYLPKKLSDNFWDTKGLKSGDFATFKDFMDAVRGQSDDGVFGETGEPSRVISVTEDEFEVTVEIELPKDKTLRVIYIPTED